MKKLIPVCAAIAILAFAGCDRRNSAPRTATDRPTGAELSDTTGHDNNNSGTARNDDSTKTQESYQAPGRIGTVERDTGHTTVETKKKTVTTKTDVSKETIPTVDITQHKADINRLSKDEWVALGVPETAARNIVDYRSKNGDFHSVDDLSRIPGLNTSWLTQMRDKLAVGEVKNQRSSG